MLKNTYSTVLILSLVLIQFCFTSLIGQKDFSERMIKRLPDAIRTEIQQQNEKEAIHRAADKWVLDSTYYYHRDLSIYDWELTSRYRVLTRDGYGNQLTATNDSYDFFQNTWNPSLDYTYTYHDENTLALHMILGWNSDSQDWLPYRERTYNKLGLLTDQIHYGFRFPNGRAWNLHFDYDAGGNYIYYIGCPKLVLLIKKTTPHF